AKSGLNETAASLAKPGAGSAFEGEACQLELAQGTNRLSCFEFHTRFYFTLFGRHSSRIIQEQSGRLSSGGFVQLGGRSLKARRLLHTPKTITRVLFFCANSGSFREQGSRWNLENHDTRDMDFNEEM